MLLRRMYSERQSVEGFYGLSNQKCTATKIDTIVLINDNTEQVQILEKRLADRIATETSNVVKTVEDRIQNAILTAIDNIIAPRIDLTVMSIRASSGKDVASVIANSESGEQVGIFASFENVSDRNNTFQELNVTDETRGYKPDEVNGLSVPKAFSDRQPQIHHNDLICKSSIAIFRQIGWKHVIIMYRSIVNLLRFLRVGSFGEGVTEQDKFSFWRNVIPSLL